jgi:hypothetical protein
MTKALCSLQNFEVLIVDRKGFAIKISPGAEDQKLENESTFDCS